jgi:hypothetical protein
MDHHSCSEHGRGGDDRLVDKIGGVGAARELPSYRSLAIQAAPTLCSVLECRFRPRFLPRIVAKALSSPACFLVCAEALLPGFVTFAAKALVLIPAAFAFFVNAPGCLIT